MVTVTSDWPLLRRWEPPTQQEAVRGVGEDDQHCRHQLSHHQLQGVVESLGGGGGGEDTHLLPLGQAEGGADSELGSGREEREEEEGEQEVGGEFLHLGRERDDQADNQVVGEALSRYNIHLHCTMYH